MLHSICQQIWKMQQWPQDWKRSVFIPIPKKGNAKKCSNCHTIALISHTSKVMLQVLQAILQKYINHGLLDVQVGFRKGRRTRDQIANIGLDHRKSKRVPEKHLFLLYWLCRSQKTVEILQEIGISDHVSVSCLLRNLYAGQKATLKTGHGTTDWFQIGKRVYFIVTLLI